MSSKKTISFFQHVYSLVQSIPPGKVTTYGHIAHAMNTRDARRVGHALHANPDASSTPCHRVVFSDGRLAPGYAFGGPNEQMRRLQLEGIECIGGRANLKKHLYVPKDE